MGYTKTEIELYESLVEVQVIYYKINETFRKNVQGYAVKNKKEMSKWVKEMLANLFEFGCIMEKVKIPKKFLILEGLKK